MSKIPIDFYLAAASRLTYNKHTGDVRWSNDPRNAPRCVGKVAGSKGKGGTIQVSFTVDGKYKQLQLHNVVWFIIHGDLPPKGYRIVPKDNDFYNLRESNLEISSISRRTASLTTKRFRGCYRNSKTGNWEAKINVDGKGIYLGTFYSEEECAQQYNKFVINNGLNRELNKL